MTDNKVIVVLGAPRSATSAVAKGCHLAGFPMGDVLLGANRSNPWGHWEDSVLVALNDRMLAELGGSWDAPPDWPVLPVSWVHDAARYIKSRGVPQWGCKDPRMVLLWPIWLAAFQQFDHDLIVLKVLRDSGVSATSLMVRDGVPMEQASRLIDVYHDRLGKIED
jgi:hypothetical protein